MMRVPVYRFVLADTLAAGIGHSLLFFLAFWFGDQFRDLVIHAEEQVDRVRPLIILTVLLAIGAYFLIRYLRRVVPTADPKELPLFGEKVAAGIESLEHKSSFLGLHRDEVVANNGQRMAVNGQATANHEQPLTNHNALRKEELERASPPAGDG
jgi:hypothetical protein